MVIVPVLRVQGRSESPAIAVPASSPSNIVESVVALSPVSKLPRSVAEVVSHLVHIPPGDSR